MHEITTNKPKIFCFMNNDTGGEGIAYAIAEDGTCLGSHYCSHEYYVQFDLGIAEGYRLDRHEDYAKHYPDGYEMEFISSENVMTHEGLLKAKEGEEVNGNQG
jgi:hypothetical protein